MREQAVGQLAGTWYEILVSIIYTHILVNHFKYLLGFFVVDLI